MQYCKHFRTVVRAPGNSHATCEGQTTSTVRVRLQPTSLLLPVPRKPRRFHEGPRLVHEVPAAAEAGRPHVHRRDRSAQIRENTECVFACHK